MRLCSAGMTKNNHPKPTRLWLIVTSLASAFGLLLLIWAALIAWLPSNLVMAERASRELTSALSAPVRVGTLEWQLLPVPKVVLQEISVGALASLRINRLSLYPSVLAALQGQLQFRRVEVESSVLPQKTVRRLVSLNQKFQTSRLAAHWLGADKPLARLVFTDLTWIPQGGIAMHSAGQVDFDDDWRPRQADIDWPASSIKGETLRLDLTRFARQDRWQIVLSQGSGRTQGEISLQTTANAAKPDALPFQLQGSLQSQKMEVAGLLKALSRPNIVNGQISGQTTLSASGQDLAELAKSLHSHSELVISNSSLPLLDLKQAIETQGKKYLGQTELDRLSLWVDTQNTSTGTVMTFSQIKASSGALSATGQANFSDQQIEAQLTVDIVDGLIGIPLEISGTADQIKIKVSKAVVLGAVLGSAALPSLGTVIGGVVGARVGAALGQVLETQPIKP